MGKAIPQLVWKGSEIMIFKRLSLTLLSLLFWLLIAYLGHATERVRDFRISTEPSPALFVQQNPRLYPTPDGGFIVAWEDYRLGEPSYFAQRFDSSGTPVGKNFPIVGNDAMAFLPDGTGMALGSRWGDWPDPPSYFSVHAQILPASGAPMRAFRIDSFLTPICGFSFWGLGVDLVAARDHFIYSLNFSGELRLKRFDRQGNLIFNSQSSFLQLPYAAVNFSLAVNKNGSYVLLWFNGDPGGLPSGIYALFMSPQDYPLADSIQVACYAQRVRHLSEGPILRAVALPNGSFQFFWVDPDSLILKYVRYSSVGQLLDSAKTFSLPRPPWERKKSDVRNFAFTALRHDGFSLLITLDHWRSIGDTLQEHYYTNWLQQFDQNGRPYGKALVDSAFFPPVGNYLARLSPSIWACPLEISGDVFISRLQHLTWLDSIQVNDDEQGANQIRPRVVAADSGRFFVSWQDKKGYYGRYVSLEGHLLDKEVELEGLETFFLPAGYAINFWKKILPSGEAAVGFTIRDRESWSLIARDTLAQHRLAKRIHAVGLPISDSSFVALVCKEDQFFLLSFHADGRRLLKKLIIQEKYYGGLGLIPNTPGSFWVLRNGRAQLYSNSLEPLSRTFNLGLYEPALYIGQGRFLTIKKLAVPSSAFYAFVVDTTGIQLQKFPIIDNFLAKNLRLVLLDSSGFLVLWRLERARKEIFARSFSLEGSPLTDLLTFHEDVESDRDWPDACVNQGRVFFVWSDTRNWGQGYDIYGSILPVSEVTSVRMEHIDLSSPQEFQLYPNYPNPFNASTTFRYELPVRSQVRLKILNILGQEVITLVDRIQKPGTHLIHWNARDSKGQLVPSGVYFGQFEAQGERRKNFSKVVKMIVLK